ncbi:hypothetical protein Moror_11651 [Moniliophthora roreri MCA 2997]|uniref:Uncharacterized protein n=1 Tax=Moniliophthora roreri (strain MCA 2997) TaxID=1381753 RepID=V2X3R8_MONRO|nr:hypothetical protein Moror_11651 [Moniliophthora roreri MCA 2997]
MSFVIPACTAVENCSQPVDVIFKSRDGKLLAGHLATLHKLNKGGFPRPEDVPSHQVQDIVRMEEKADVLELLLIYSHDDEHLVKTLRQIDPSVGIDAVLGLVDTAHKYMNFFAENAARVAIEEMALKSDSNAPKMSPHLNDRNFRIFALYQEKWQVALANYQETVENYHPNWRSPENGYEKTFIRAVQALLPSAAAVRVPSEDDVRRAYRIARRAHPLPDEYINDGDVEHEWWIRSVYQATDDFPKWQDFAQTTSSLNHGSQNVPTCSETSRQESLFVHPSPRVRVGCLGEMQSALSTSLVTYSVCVVHYLGEIPRMSQPANHQKNKLPWENVNLGHQVEDKNGAGGKT